MVRMRGFTVETLRLRSRRVAINYDSLWGDEFIWAL
jgi:hypothetical protein